MKQYEPSWRVSTHARTSGPQSKVKYERRSVMDLHSAPANCGCGLCVYATSLTASEKYDHQGWCGRKTAGQQIPGFQELAQNN